MSDAPRFNRACIVDLDDPWTESHGGTLRTRLFIDALCECGFETHVVYLRSPQSITPSVSAQLHPIDRTTLGGRGWTVPVRKLKKHFLPMPTMRGGMLPEVQAAVQACDPDLIVVSQIRAAPYAYAVQGANLWLDQADVWSAFLDQEIRARRALARSSARMQQAHIRRHEVSWSGRATVVTAAGYADTERLSRMSGRRVEWLPTVVPGGHAARTPGIPPTAGFLANFAYWPNRDAFAMLQKDWAPVLRAHGWRVIVAGLHSESLEPTPGIEVMGEVDDLRTFYSEIDVALAPMRLGGGIKVKVVEALLWGRPVVGTAAAVDGLPPDISHSIPTVNRPTELPAALAAAARDVECIGFARDRFSESGFKSKVAELVNLAIPGDRNDALVD